MRIILYTGKGGVGKTSVSAATGLLCAELGYRTLVMSTDPAHSLSDSFNMKLGAEPTEICDGLFGMEIDPFAEIEENWAAAKDYLTTLFASQGLDEVAAEELAVLPGMDELFSLLKVKQFYESKEFDVLIVDCAPTGATIRLLNFPEVLQWYMRRLFHVERYVVGTIRRFKREIFSVPLPDDAVFDTIQRMYANVDEMRDILLSSQVTTIRLVLNPERMVIQETRRAYTYLNLFGFHTDAIIANKVFPEEVADSYFSEWKRVQEAYLEEVEASFPNLPIFKVRFYEHEVVGIESLRKMAYETFGDSDPTRIFAQDEPMQVLKDSDGYALVLTLPFVSRSEVELYQKGDELIIRIGNFKRNIILPMTLARLEAVGAKFVEGKLHIRFADRRGAQRKAR
ncbi:MAG: ArsA family ATPase [Armatimonadota bacterium]|nr:ArsA family ATPase [Armatimonadota bacterium]MCX7776940.1 ArsA family ATPase [Armatimonadota bacterium]MDW8024774.1 ArsA family ATPase [Armatimonadota bacterium]